MIQQINLYQKEFRPTRNRARQLSQAGAALLFVMLVGSNYYLSTILGGLEAELAMKGNELNSLEQSNQALQITAKPRAMDMNLAERVQKVKRSNDDKLRAMNYLSTGGAGNVAGFSSLLQGLGRQRDEVEELWLKNIQFSDGGYEMRLAGSNYQPELLPEFIQALNKEVLYKDREFREIKITRSTQDNKVVDFVLATRDNKNTTGTKAGNVEKELFMARLNRLNEEDKVNR